MNDIHQSFAQQGLVRPPQGRVLGGVCAGLGRRFGIAPWPARILFVLLLMVIPGSQILIYCRLTRAIIRDADSCLVTPGDGTYRAAPGQKCHRVAPNGSVVQTAVAVCGWRR
jgi:phage shock protein C